MEQRFLSVVTEAEFGRLVVPDARLVSHGRAEGILARKIGLDQWQRLPTLPAGLTHATMLSEMAWVAKCSLIGYRSPSVAVAMRSASKVMRGDALAASQLFYDLAVKSQENPGVSAWIATLALLAHDDPGGNAQRLLDHCCVQHADQAPALSCWSDSVALLGGRSSLDAGQAAAPASPERMLTRMHLILEEHDLGRQLADLQSFYDTSSRFKECVRQAGLGRYKWTNPGGQIREDDMAGAPLFLGAVDAMRWLIESIMLTSHPRDDRPTRTRMRPIRDLIMHKELVLVDINRRQALDVQAVLATVDDLLAPAGALKGTPLAPLH